MLSCQINQPEVFGLLISLSVVNDQLRSKSMIPEDKCFKGEIVAEGDCDTAPGAAEVCCKTRGYCHLTNVPCANNTVCLPYPYPSGPAQTTQGTCEELGEDFVDDKGANLVRDAAGNPITATIHVLLCCYQSSQ